MSGCEIAYGNGILSILSLDYSFYLNIYTQASEGVSLGLFYIWRFVSLVCVWGISVYFIYPVVFFCFSGLMDMDMDYRSYWP